MKAGKTPPAQKLTPPAREQRLQIATGTGLSETRCIGHQPETARGASGHQLHQPARNWPARKKARSPSPPHPNCPAAPPYNRALDLPPLIPLWPAELRDISPEGTKEIIAKLTAAIRGERRRGQQGHWAYDLNRHAGLHRVLKAEQGFLKSIESNAAMMNSFFAK